MEIGMQLHLQQEQSEKNAGEQTLSSVNFDHSPHNVRTPQHQKCQS